MNPDMFYQVITPLISVKNTAVLAITTPQRGFNYFNDLMNLPGGPNGGPLFDVVRLAMVCAACAASGNACTHMLDMNPHWRPPERMAKVDAIMASNPALRDQETRGQSGENMQTVIDSKHVEAFHKRPRFVFPDHAPTVLFCAIDPSGGGSGSEFAIATFALRSNTQPILVGLDSTNALYIEGVEKMIRNHFMRIKTHRRYRNSFVIGYPEANMSWYDTQRYAKMYYEIFGPDGCEVVRRDPKKKHRYGVWTDPKDKVAWVYQMKTRIHLMQVAQDRDFITSSGTPKEMIQRFCDQLKNFRQDMKHAGRTPDEWRANPTFNYTGKSVGKTDDLFAAAAIALVQMDQDVFRKPDPELAQRLQQSGRALTF